MDRCSQTMARPYRMRNQIQTYAWGTRGADAFIPRLLGVEPQPDTPYAELWMGAHPKAPSTIELPGGETMALDRWIAAHPVEALGRSVAESYGALPFLFKVLSAGQALSIQAHPTRAQAVKLHREDPEHYPDDNHKPEIAIALDRLTALMGFKPYGAFVRTLGRYPELGGFVGPRLAERAARAQRASALIQAMMIREVFATLVQQATETPEVFGEAVEALAHRLKAGFEALDEAEALFLELRERYGSQDVGLFALLLLNIVHLSAGEGIYTAAGVPHAYLKGNIVECMANSDNVVRVGLTPKFRDAKTLLKIVDTTPRIPEIMNGNPRVIGGNALVATYSVPAPEFTVARWAIPAGSDVSAAKGEKPAVLLVTQGRADIVWDGGRESFDRGETAFLPACLTSYLVKAPVDAEVILAGVSDPGVQATVAQSA
ncbi:MAG: mannose-6-phosphate isomerase, class I [Anaerolineae bacterium]|nr:mannose-6-phosphate isomerase, class I [Anaerolineae bacterium]